MSLLGIVSGLLLATAVEAAQFRSWRFDPQQNRLEFTTDAAVQPRAQLLFNPTRIVVDLPGTTLEQRTIKQAVDGAVAAVRIGQFDAQTTRLVMELAPGYTLNPDQIVVRGEMPQQWVVQLPPTQAGTPPQATPSQVNATPVAGAAIPAIPAVPPPNSGIPKQAVTIVIDPDHGGRDPGAIGVGGLREKDVTSAIAYEVASILEQGGARVILTRSNDQEIDLAPRAQIAERANADLFVSIHANSISLSRPDVNGLETYYHSSGNRLAQGIHQSILRLVNMRDRGVRQARFHVLVNTSMPSVLVETGFVTGAQDARNFNNPAWRSRMAQGIAAGILQYAQQTL